MQLRCNGKIHRRGVAKVYSEIERTFATPFFTFVEGKVRVAKLQGVIVGMICKKHAISIMAAKLTFPANGWNCLTIRHNYVITIITGRGRPQRPQKRPKIKVRRSEG